MPSSLNNSTAGQVICPDVPPILIFKESVCTTLKLKLFSSSFSIYSVPPSAFDNCLAPSKIFSIRTSKSFSLVRECPIPINIFICCLFSSCLVGKELTVEVSKFKVSPSTKIFPPFKRFGYFVSISSLISFIKIGFK